VTEVPPPRRLWKALLAAVEILREPSGCQPPKEGDGLAQEPVVTYDASVADRPTVGVPQRTENDWNMTDRQLAFIEARAREAPLQRFLEIGVYFGTTTCILAQIGNVDAVDWFRGNAESGLWAPLQREHSRRVDGFLSTLDRMGVRDHVRVLEGTSGDVVPHLRHEQFGLVLIDGDHSFNGALTDLRNSYDLVVPGGFLLMDDYYIAQVNFGVRDDVRRAWRAFSAERRLNGDLKFTSPDPENHKLVAVRKP
jgi:hypothetical protein